MSSWLNTVQCCKFLWNIKESKGFCVSLLPFNLFSNFYHSSRISRPHYLDAGEWIVWTHIPLLRVWSLTSEGSCWGWGILGKELGEGILGMHSGFFKGGPRGITPYWQRVCSEWQRMDGQGLQISPGSRKFEIQWQLLWIWSARRRIKGRDDCTTFIGPLEVVSIGSTSWNILHNGNNCPSLAVPCSLSLYW